MQRPVFEARMTAILVMLLPDIDFDRCNNFHIRYLLPLFLNIKHLGIIYLSTY